MNFHISCLCHELIAYLRKRSRKWQMRGEHSPTRDTENSHHLQKTCLRQGANTHSILKMHAYKRLARRSQMQHILTWLLQVAVASVDYSFANGKTREKDSFGLDTGGRMMLVAADKFPEMVRIMQAAYPDPSAIKWYIYPWVGKKNLEGGQ